MFKQKTKDDNTPVEQLSVSAFGYEILRSDLLPELLGKQERNILYWAGRHLARKYPLHTMEEVHAFFIEAGWGNLEMIEASKTEMLFSLHSVLIEQRIENFNHQTFSLEAGFLAEQVQLQKKCTTEALESVKRNKVSITVQWDKKDTIE
ncbi:YslB family protein [Fictibacillus sp. b24]|uniref:YslB family protein n=1 Tax=Fictibacillus sp. b24 TaxID=3055863 RepID=UPI0025A14854|nr:YslB family protein [Fictibacillus sp. b24]MDM5315654.1 YslB family protein [Fictibacillus sp. b24]